MILGPIELLLAVVGRVIRSVFVGVPNVMSLEM